jgi:hypothetical protein
VATPSSAGQVPRAPSLDDRTVGPDPRAPAAPVRTDENLTTEERLEKLFQRMLVALQNISVILAPPTLVKMLDITLTHDGPITLLNPPMPGTLSYFEIKIFGANPITIWFINTGTTVPNQNYITIAAGEYRRYPLAPFGGIYAARTPGMSTVIQFGYFY